MNSKYINSNLKRLLKENPTSVATIEILRLKRERNYPDFYTTLDSLGFWLGIECINQEVENEYGDTLGYLPSIKYAPHNPLGRQPGVYKLNGFDNRYKSESKAWRYLAKEYFYLLERACRYISNTDVANTNPTK